jgi:hypothetical protein
MIAMNNIDIIGFRLFNEFFIDVVSLGWGGGGILDRNF